MSVLFGALLSTPHNWCIEAFYISYFPCRTMQCCILFSVSIFLVLSCNVKQLELECTGPIVLKNNRVYLSSFIVAKQLQEGFWAVLLRFCSIKWNPWFLSCCTGRQQFKCGLWQMLSSDRAEFNVTAWLNPTWLFAFILTKIPRQGGGLEVLLLFDKWSIFSTSVVMSE